MRGQKRSLGIFEMSNSINIPSLKSFKSSNGLQVNIFPPRIIIKQALKCHLAAIIASVHHKPFQFKEILFQKILRISTIEKANSTKNFRNKSLQSVIHYFLTIILFSELLTLFAPL